MAREETEIDSSASVLMLMVDDTRSLIYLCGQKLKNSWREEGGHSGYAKFLVMGMQLDWS